MLDFKRLIGVDENIDYCLISMHDENLQLRTSHSDYAKNLDDQQIDEIKIVQSRRRKMRHTYKI